MEKRDIQEIIEGVIPDHLKKKAEGGIIETGNIARRPGAVPPLSDRPLREEAS